MSTKVEVRKAPGSDSLGRPINHVVPPSERQPIVTDWTGPDDYVNAPPSYDAFYRQYASYTRFLVDQFGVHPNDFDDVVMEIIMRFIERDSLGVFNRDWSTRSATGKSNFRSYYSRFVVTYARGKKRSRLKHKQHYVLIINDVVEDDGTIWLEEYIPDQPDDKDTVLWDMMFEDLVSRIKTEIDESLYNALFVLLDLAAKDERVSTASLARNLRVGPSRARTIFAELRAAIVSAVLDPIRVGGSS